MCASGAKSPEAPTEPCDGTTGMISCAQHRFEKIESYTANAGRTLAEARKLQRHHQPRDIDRQRLTYASRVGQNDVPLQPGQIRSVDANTG